MIAGVARIAALAPVLLALASASAGASGARPPVALTASPAHLELTGAARATVRITNSGTNPVVLDVRRAGFALDPRGRPKIVGQHGARRTAASWLGFRPRSLALRPGSTGGVTITSRVPVHAEPGDHDALVLFTSRRRVRDGLAVRVRMGVVVVVRAPGTVVRRLELRGLRVTRAGHTRVLEVGVTNRGNVTESISRARSTLSCTATGGVSRSFAPSRESCARARMESSSSSTAALSEVRSSLEWMSRPTRPSVPCGGRSGLVCEPEAFVPSVYGIARRVSSFDAMLTSRSRSSPSSSP